MKFIINETNAYEEIQYLDEKTGIEWTSHIIFETGAVDESVIKYDEEKEAYRINQDDFDWWNEYFTHKSEDEEKLEELREKYEKIDPITGRSNIDDIIIEHFKNESDLEREHQIWQKIFEKIEE